MLADRLVILEAGRITQAGTPAEVTARPASRYVAELVGINLLHGTAAGERTVRLDTGADPHRRRPAARAPTSPSPSAPRPSRSTATSPTAAPATPGPPPSPTSRPTATACG